MVQTLTEGDWHTGEGKERERKRAGEREEIREIKEAGTQAKREGEKTDRHTNRERGERGSQRLTDI